MNRSSKKIIYVIMLLIPFFVNWIGGLLYLFEFKPRGAKLVWLILAFIPFVNIAGFIMLLLDALGIIKLNG